MPEFVYIPIYYICAYTECHKFNWKRIQLVTGGGCGNVEGSLLRCWCSGCGSGSGSGSGLIWPQLGLVRVQWATLDAIGIRIVIANRFSEIQFQLQKKSLEKSDAAIRPNMNVEDVWWQVVLIPCKQLQNLYLWDYSSSCPVYRVCLCNHFNELQTDTSDHGRDWATCFQYECVATQIDYEKHFLRF